MGGHFVDLVWWRHKNVFKKGVVHRERICGSYTIIVLTKYYIMLHLKSYDPSFFILRFLRCLSHYQGLWVTATIKRVLVDIYLLWHYMVWWTMYLFMLKRHMFYPVRRAKYRDARKMKEDNVVRLQSACKILVLSEVYFTQYTFP